MTTLVKVTNDPPVAKYKGQFLIFISLNLLVAFDTTRSEKYELRLWYTISKTRSFYYLLLVYDPQIYKSRPDICWEYGWMNELIFFSTLHLRCLTNSIIKCEGKVEYIVSAHLTSFRIMSLLQLF